MREISDIEPGIKNIERSKVTVFQKHTLPIEVNGCLLEVLGWYFFIPYSAFVIHYSAFVVHGRECGKYRISIQE